jgi:asparagine synthase (glutamine-hydrolysing)
MCGIAGYVDLERGTADAALLERMAESIRHRGPDEGGIWFEAACGLAHRRLSIIDLSGSRQPLVPKGGPLALVYNGELYNYVELRARYRERGIAFETRGDTEAVLRGLEQRWGDALADFDGMYAFAAWDRVRKRLLLARDPLGKKPLFYATPRPGLIVFGSEVKALLAHPEVPCALDEDGLRQAVRFRAVYGDGSLYRGIRQVPPGATLEWSGAAPAIDRRYRLEEQSDGGPSPRGDGSPDGLIEHGRRILRAAVEKRLVADVPVGAFLSGGLDSSLIVALMQEIRAGNPATHTFSVGFEGDADSELGFAALAARALSTQHTEVRLSASDYAAALGEATAFRDAPLSEPADIAILRMSEIAKQTVKVVLSGEGSDEVFCGYPKYALARVPEPLRAAVRALGPQRIANAAGSVGLDARRALVAARSLAGRTELDRLVQWFSYFDRGELARLLPGLGWDDASWSRTTVAHARVLATCASADPLLRMQLVDGLTWLPGNLLERGDRMTMAAGLELRVPFLDPALVRYGLQLPARMKVRGRTLKWVVRRWAEAVVPRAIIERPKWGFRVPLAAWFRGELRDALHDRVRSASGICGRYGDRTEIDSLLASHDHGETDRNLTLWTLLTAEVWYQGVFLRASS